MMKLLIMAAVIITAALWYSFLESAKEPFCTQTINYTIVRSIESKIRSAARRAGVSGDTLVKIAKCESGLNPLAKNKTSTASGLFQIISSTFRYHGCDGDVFDVDANIACAVKIIQKNPNLSDWNASKSCWS